MRHYPKTCHTCGNLEHQDLGLEYNDRFFCSLKCKLAQERKDDESLATRTTVVRLPTSSR